jgi:inner membrane protein
LPAGYILIKKLQARYDYNKYTWVGLLASILPDFDVISFYINHYEIPHHDYWPHYPFYWLLIGIFAFPVIHLIKIEKYRMMFIFSFANIFLHLFLDTITGEVKWLYPFSDQYISFFNWQLIYSFWGSAGNFTKIKKNITDPLSLFVFLLYLSKI